MTGLIGSKKWPHSQWQEMLRGFMPILDAHRSGVDWWTFGGGTSLFVHLGHRISYDIDLFLDSSRDLKALTPYANPMVKAFQGDLSYEYPGNYLKLYRPQGEIDLIVATSRTEPGTVPWDFEGHPVWIDTPVETAIKKMFYRPSTFKIRDVFDVAAVIDTGHADDLAAAMGEVADRLNLVLDRLELLAPVYDEQVWDDVNPTEIGLQWMHREAAVDPLIDFIRGWQLSHTRHP